MSWDITRENLRTFFRKAHHPVTGFLICYLFAFFLQLTTFGILIVIAGGIGGFLVKNGIRATIATFLAGTSVWLTFFAIMYILNPLASIAAWFIISPIIPAPQIVISFVGGVLTGIGGQLGVILAGYAYPPETELPLPRPRTETPTKIPTKDLPRRRPIKRKVKRKKKKRRK
ncbi:MAG: hypothetical protein ACFFDP_09780 [Promethearchaeota archaeon]